MTTLELDGLTGDNPLYVMAALGALALTTDLDGEHHAALGWVRRGGTYAARLVTRTTTADWCQQVANRLKQAAVLKEDPDAASHRRQAKEYKAEWGRAVTALKSLRKAVTQEIKSRGLTGADKAAWGRDRLSAASAEVARLSQCRRDAESRLAASLGFGPAHLGDVIGVPVDAFRLHAVHALDNDPATARQLGGLATDACTSSGNVEPSPYSFSNRSSGKELLKDFRNVAAVCTAADVEASCLRGTPALRAATALNWDPRDQRNYALQWADPGSAMATTDTPANALAYVGLGVLSCFPGRRGLAAVALARIDDARCFTWPLWSSPLSLPLVRALLAAASTRDFLGDPATLHARGVLAVYRSVIVNPTGKRNFFAPATPVVPG
jgi:hypothetical protein